MCSKLDRELKHWKKIASELDVKIQDNDRQGERFGPMPILDTEHQKLVDQLQKVNATIANLEKRKGRFWRILKIRWQLRRMRSKLFWVETEPSCWSDLRRSMESNPKKFGLKDPSGVPALFARYVSDWSNERQNIVENISKLEQQLKEEGVIL